MVNVFCLQGNINQGIDVAKDMYQEAKMLNHSLGKALALQAIGATYMYADQYEQARIAFSEAEPSIYSEGDSLLKANLTIQQLHTCLMQEDTPGMVSYLLELERLTNDLPTQAKEIYLFYLTCYETLLQIKTNHPQEAQQSLENMHTIMPSDSSLNIWRYLVLVNFYKMEGKDKETLTYLDSTLQILKRQEQTHAYQNSIYEKADLLEKNNDYQGACKMYALADSLKNIMDMEHYIKQIENLHLTYYVDQVAIENTQIRNKFLSYILLCLLIGIVVSSLVILMARKRNRQLALSRERLDKIRQMTADSIQSKSMFLSNMSHDLRTPLNAIVGFSDILTTTEDIDPELKQECRDYIRQNSDLLMKLVNDIVDLSTLQDGKIKFDFGKYDVVGLCRNVIETISKVKQTKAELTFSSTVEKLEIETDSGRLQQVLINLLTNAVKFTQEGSIRLLLDYNSQTQEAIFTVEDTGCGIPLEKQARIFKRFEKLHESAQGVGLGLSICQLIINQVNGKIWIDSKYTQGARFIFTHPIVHTLQQPSV